MTFRPTLWLLILLTASPAACVQTTTGPDRPNDNPTVRTVTGWIWTQDQSRSLVRIEIDRWITAPGEGDLREGDDPFFDVWSDRLFREVENGAVPATEEDLEMGQTLHIWLESVRRGGDVGQHVRIVQN